MVPKKQKPLLQLRMDKALILRLRVAAAARGIRVNELIAEFARHLPDVKLGTGTEIHW